MLIVSRLGYVPDPLDGPVSTLLIDSQVSHSQARGREHRDLELHGDGGLSPGDGLGGVVVVEL